MWWCLDIEQILIVLFDFLQRSYSEVNCKIFFKTYNNKVTLFPEPCHQSLLAATMWSRASTGKRLKANPKSSPQYPDPLSQIPPCQLWLTAGKTSSQWELCLATPIWTHPCPMSLIRLWRHFTPSIWTRDLTGESRVSFWRLKMPGRVLSSKKLVIIFSVQLLSLCSFFNQYRIVKFY